MSDGVLGWHFLGDDGRVARLGTKVTAGLVLAMPGPVTLCSRGFHASVRAIDALGYAQGNVVERVRLSGVVVKGDDKMVATRRACLWVLTRKDTERCLWVAACNFAQVALDAERAAGRTPDPRSQAAIDTRLRWIDGEATDADLRAAYKAARNAVDSAAYGRTHRAVYSATYSAAHSAACGAAYGAADGNPYYETDGAAFSAADSAANSAAYNSEAGCCWEVYDEAYRAANGLQNEILEAAFTTMAEQRGLV